jgi:sugar-specific transcriptional regulator TrmB
MIEDNEIIKKTKLFGLNTYESKIWITLLGRGTSTAGELSDMANVPRSRSYDVLESLEKKGFVIAKHGKPIRYLAVPPGEVLENIKKQIEKDTEKHLLTIKNTNFNDLIDSFQQIYEKNANTKENIVAVLHGRNNIHKHLSYLFNNSKEIVISVEKDTEEHTEMMDDTKDRSKKAIKISKTGLRVCIAGEEDTIIFPLSRESIHPDYDLCIWIKNKPTSDFLKSILC